MQNLGREKPGSFLPHTLAAVHIRWLRLVAVRKTGTTKWLCLRPHYRAVSFQDPVS